MPKTIDEHSQHIVVGSRESQPPRRHIKVLHFIDSGGIYGAEKVILSLAQQMTKHDDYCPVVGCIVQRSGAHTALADKARSLGIEAVEIVINNRRFPVDLALAARRIRKLGIGLIHSHGYKPSVFGYFISKLIKVPVMATCHLWYSGVNPPFKYKLMTKAESFLYRFFPKIVCVSPRIMEILRARNISPQRLVIIDNGIDVDDQSLQKSRTARALARRALFLGEDDFIILNVGRLSEQKGQRAIVALAATLATSGISAVFLIAGEGEERSALEKLISDKGLNSSVKLLGFCEDIGPLLNAADVFLLPSLDEGMPMSLLEAMAGGVPVIATPVGAIPQLIQHEKEGLLVGINAVGEMHAALVKLMRSPALAATLADNALLKVKQGYSSATMYHRYRTIYDEVVGSDAEHGSATGA